MEKDIFDDVPYFGICVMVILFVIMMLYIGSNWDEPKLSERPCGYFADFPLKLIPARCINYFAD